MRCFTSKPIVGYFLHDDPWQRGYLLLIPCGGKNRREPFSPGFLSPNVLFSVVLGSAGATVPAGRTGNAILPWGSCRASSCLLPRPSCGVQAFKQAAQVLPSKLFSVVCEEIWKECSHGTEAEVAQEGQHCLNTTKAIM